MHGFRLTQEAENEGFSGGTINANPLGHAFDVGKSLEDGHGIIVTDDDHLAGVLRSYAALESVPEGEIPADAVPVGIPGAEVLKAPNTGPWVPQNPPTAEQLAAAGEGEIAAEHQDEPDTDAGALQQGEEVSGPPPASLGSFGTTTADQLSEEEHS